LQLSVFLTHAPATLVGRLEEPGWLWPPADAERWRADSIDNGPETSWAGMRKSRHPDKPVCGFGLRRQHEKAHTGFEPVPPP
jgi:hypothetical protein